MRRRLIHAFLPLIASLGVLMLAACASRPADSNTSSSEPSPGDLPIVSMRTTMHSAIGLAP